MPFPRFVCLLASAFVLSGPVLAQADPAATDGQVRERLNFDSGWLFQRGDPPDVHPNQIDYPQLKDFLLAGASTFTKGTPVTRPEWNPGADVSYVKPDFDDRAWRALNLPHDWAIEGPFDLKGEGSTGKLPYAGQAWYRKHFRLPANDAGRRIFLDIDGAMSYSTVWVNGQFAGGWPYGYSSYELEITGLVKAGGDNLVSIRLNNPAESSRWYPGAGIYRHVWLVKTAPVHIDHWGTYVTTPEVNPDSATIRLKGAVVNQGGDDAVATVATRIYELDGNGTPAPKPVDSLPSVSVKLAAGGRQTFEVERPIAHPKLWDLDHPQRYLALTEVTCDGKVVDRYPTVFGVRTIQFDPARGFLLNGKNVAINGVCDHHDLGALGAAFNLRAAERQLEILKEMGCNALRTSHNMPAPELLDLCDRMGILVMDESFDCWVIGKRPGDYHNLFPDWHEPDLRAEYRRDRNHPSIILWSIGNEVNELDTPEGASIAAELTGIAHDEDPTRPTVFGSNDGAAWRDDAAHGIKAAGSGVDIYGQNYDTGVYAAFEKGNPCQPIIGSETASCVSSRGIYYFPVSYDKGDGRGYFQMSSYDLYAPPWATTPDMEFAALDHNPFVAGEFVWTGFDYLGEPTPYNGDLTNLLNFHDPAEIARATAELTQLGRLACPARSSYFGIVDLCGFKKDRFYLYQARWRPDLPMVHILPHWNWPTRVGQVTPVHVYTSGDEVELFLNGKSLGRKRKGPYQYRLTWDDVVYAPGELKALAYKEGKPWAETTVRTTGAATALRLEADRPAINGDGEDLCYITTRVVDKDGLPVPVSQNRIKYEIVDGPGEVVATDNGDATDLEIFSQPERKAFNGFALLIVRAKAGQSGKIRIRATSEGLTSSELTVRAR
jgi:beta-galactosidase